MIINTPSPKKLVILMVLLLAGLHLNAQDTPDQRLFDNEPVDTQVYSSNAVDIPAYYLGGEDSLNRYILNRMSFPRRYGKKGSLRLSFVVHPDSTISDIRVIRGQELDAMTKNSAMQAVSMMTRMWVPARRSDQAVRSRVVLDVKIDK